MRCWSESGVPFSVPLCSLSFLLLTSFGCGCAALCASHIFLIAWATVRKTVETVEDRWIVE